MIKIILNIVFIGSIFLGHAQFNQNHAHYLVNPEIQNPAFIGYNVEPQAAFIWRQQWTGIEGAPSTQWLSCDTRFPDNNNAIGGYISMDRLGVSQLVKIAPGYSHSFSLSKDLKFAFGLNAGLSIVNHNWSELDVQDASDELFAQGSPTFISPNLAFGLRLNSKKFFAGISIPEFFNQNSRNTFLQGGTTQIQLFSGYQYTYNRDIKFIPGFAFKANFNGDYQFDANLIGNYKDLISLGLSIRQKDAVGVLLGMKVNQQFKFSYVYELTTSDLSTYSRGSHELSLRYLFSYNNKLVNPRFF